jgi:membrane protein DedA with SNARE-associated domain
MEAGVPVPLPSDFLMLAIGARVSAGDIPLWVAVLAFEGVAIIGTTALFFVARGPGHAFVARVGPRLGLNEVRLARATRLLDRRGRPALAVGRGTPGLRTLTVITAGGSGLSSRQALPALVVGSSVFLQLHLFIGYFAGSSARHVLRTATGPALAVLAVLVLGALTFWLARRGKRPGVGLVEASCPACLALAFLAEQPHELEELIQSSG